MPVDILPPGGAVFVKERGGGLLGKRCPVRRGPGWDRGEAFRGSVGITGDRHSTLWRGGGHSRGGGGGRGAGRNGRGTVPGSSGMTGSSPVRLRGFGLVDLGELGRINHGVGAQAEGGGIYLAEALGQHGGPGCGAGRCLLRDCPSMNWMRSVSAMRQSWLNPAAVTDASAGGGIEEADFAERFRRGRPGRAKPDCPSSSRVCGREAGPLMTTMDLGLQRAFLNDGRPGMAREKIRRKNLTIRDHRPNR